MTSLNVEQLHAKYPDVEWKSKFVKICDLIEILTDCIISDEYTIPDTLNSAITLSPAGKEMRTRLISKESVPVKEANLMCFLTLGHEDLYVDVDGTDIASLVAAIDHEISNRRILFPFIFGRDLYDRFAGLYEDEKDSLTPVETQKLLSELPMGVFQYGNYTTGPYGLREATTGRSLSATRRVLAYHCSRASCRTIHPVVLETSHSAKINSQRETLYSILRALPVEASEWWAFAAEINGLVAASYGDRDSAVILPLVGDCLAISELRLLLRELLDYSKGSVRQDLKTFVQVENAEEFTGQLDRAEMLQLILFAPERTIATALDRLLRKGSINVPPGEVRSPVVTSSIRSGAFRLHPELGHYGVRFASTDRGVALLRQRRLFDRLYLRSQGGDVSELEWQLRGVEVEDLDERLDLFFRKTNPREALGRLVLARRTNVITACEDVGIEDADGMSDTALIETILWKLGFEIAPTDDPHADFWKRHERLWALTQSSDMGASERFLESASPYFSCLEGLLLDALAYSAWALLTDHTKADSPFSYDDNGDRAEGLALMNAIVSSPVGTSDFSADLVDLSLLIGGFSCLSRHLEQAIKLKEDRKRPDSELPEFDGKTDIKTFLLRSTIPFLDLTPPSQLRILNGLKEITRLLAHAEVSAVRNDYAHYRRSSPDAYKVETALEATRQAVTRIEMLGFCRLLFAPVRVLRDPWGHSTHEFKGPRSYEHEFSRPTRYDWMGLPTLDETMYLMTSASVGEPTEVLRFVRRYSSEFSSMWSSFPSRRRKPRSNTPDEVESHTVQATSVPV